MVGFFGKMLTHLKNKIQALQSFSFQNELVTIIETNKDKLADLQAQQLYRGVDINEQPLTLDGGGYAPFTIQEKIKKGQPYDRITWRDSGAFYLSLKAQISGSKYSIKSDSFKFDKLKKRSGAKAIGLGLESRRDFALEITRPNILKVYKEKVTDVS
jgi:hypothetical protein